MAGALAPFALPKSEFCFGYEKPGLRLRRDFITNNGRDSEDRLSRGYALNVTTALRMTCPRRLW